MKINIEQIISFIGSIIIAALLWFWVSSCSSAYHLNKFYKKGGKIEPVERVVTLYDTIIQGGDTVIIPRFVNVDCPEPVAPETRYEIRWKYRVKTDSIEVEKWRTKYIYKTVKQEQKTNRTKTRSTWIWIPFVALLGIAIWLISLNRKDDKRKDLY